MGNYIPPYQISDKMLQYVSSISEKVGQITERSNIESKPHLRRNNKIKSIHSSLRIEANSLSLDEVRDVFNGRMVLGAVKEIQEVKNAYPPVHGWQWANGPVVAYGDSDAVEAHL